MTRSEVGVGRELSGDDGRARPARPLEGGQERVPADPVHGRVRDGDAVQVWYETDRGYGVEVGLGRRGVEEHRPVDRPLRRARSPPGPTASIAVAISTSIGDTIWARRSRYTLYPLSRAGCGWQ